METLTSREAAERLGIAVSTFHKWVTDGKLTPVKQLDGLRGAKLFDPADVEALRNAVTA